MKKLMIFLLTAAFVFTSILMVTAQSTIDFVSDYTSSDIINSTFRVGDTYEPNGSLSDAYSIANGVTYESYIYSSGDEDYYYFDAAAGTINIALTNLSKNYNLYLFNSEGTAIAKSENTSANNEDICFQASQTDRFYVKITGSDGAYSATQSYKLKADFTLATPQWYYESVYVESNNSYTYQKTGAQSVAVRIMEPVLSYGDTLYVKDKYGNIIEMYEDDMSHYDLEVDSYGNCYLWASAEGDTVQIQITRHTGLPDCFYIDQARYYSVRPLP